MAERLYPVGGELDLASAQEMQRRLLVFIDATSDDLVLDCTDLEFIDSVGIGVFAHTQRVLEVQGRRLRIVNMSERVRRPFDILGLTDDLGIEVLDRA